MVEDKVKNIPKSRTKDKEMVKIKWVNVRNLKNKLSRPAPK